MLYILDSWTYPDPVLPIVTLDVTKIHKNVIIPKFSILQLIKTSSFRTLDEGILPDLYMQMTTLYKNR